MGRRGFDVPSVVILMESGDDRSRLEKFWRDEQRGQAAATFSAYQRAALGGWP
jgi:hypothetical protein